MFPTIGAIELPKSHWAAGPMTGHVAARSPLHGRAALRCCALVRATAGKPLATAFPEEKLLGQRKPDEFVFVYASRRIERARSWCSVHFHPPRRWGSGS